MFMERIIVGALQTGARPTWGFTQMTNEDFDEIKSERQREIDERRKKATQTMMHLMQVGQTITGRVKHVAFNHANQMTYGFITPDDSSLDDLFVHHSEIEPWRDGFKELTVGDVVKFKVSKGAGRNVDKWQAVNVEVDREATKSAAPFRHRQGASGFRRTDDDRGNR